MEYSFLVESIDLLHKSMDWFLYDNVLRHERVKTNRTWVKNGPITRNRVLPVTTLFLLKIWFSLRTSYKYLFWCTNDLNVHIHTFCKRWSFIWGWFFPVSIFKIVLAASTLWQNSSKTRLPQKNICGGVHSYCNWNFKIYIWKLKIKAVYTMQCIQRQRFSYIHVVRSSRWRCSVKKGILKNFTNFTGKHLRWSLFSGLQLYYKETPAQGFSN